MNQPTTLQRPRGVTDRVCSVSLALAQRSAALTFSDLPADVRTRVRQGLLDWAASALAGAQEPLTRMLAEEAREQGGHGQATVVGHGFATSTRQAALVNGTAAHALGHGETNEAFSARPALTLVAALLALAEARGASGKAFMAAFVAGHETLCCVGAAVAPGRAARGLKGSGSIGAIGAAAACAHLLQLGTEDTAVALGIAATEAGGWKSMFGSQCLPMHAGKASADGLLAAQLAARGFASHADATRPMPGAAAAQRFDFDAEAALAAPAHGFHIRAHLFNGEVARDAESPELAARHARLESKFLRLAGPRLDAESCDEVLNLIARLETLPDLSPLAGLLSARPIQP